MLSFQKYGMDRILQCITSYDWLCTQYNLPEIHPICSLYIHFSFDACEMVCSVCFPQFASLAIMLVKDAWADSSLACYTQKPLWAFVYRFLCVVINFHFRGWTLNMWFLGHVVISCLFFKKTFFRLALFFYFYFLCPCHQFMSSPANSHPYHFMF